VVRVNVNRISVPDLCRILESEGIDFQVLDDLPGAVRVAGADIVNHRVCVEGLCFLMDSNSQRVAGMLEPTGAGLLGDFCAAPGGKSFILRSRMPESTAFVCSDLDFTRLTQMRRRAQRYGIDGIDYLQMDVGEKVPSGPVFDAILLDVPCSGLGTVRANPDIRWTVQEADLERYQRQQIRMLESAFPALRNGGELLYSTCSTEPEENEQVVDHLLLSQPQAKLAGGYWYSWEEGKSGEGFFAARIRRV
jgi:16S rRNA (cytosine967-C5)-methyltransferase